MNLYRIASATDNALRPDKMNIYTKYVRNKLNLLFASTVTVIPSSATGGSSITITEYTVPFLRYEVCRECKVYIDITA